MRDCFLASFPTAQIGSAHQASVWARLIATDATTDRGRTRGFGFSFDPLPQIIANPASYKSIFVFFHSTGSSVEYFKTEKSSQPWAMADENELSILLYNRRKGIDVVDDLERNIEQRRHHS